MAVFTFLLSSILFISTSGFSQTNVFVCSLNSGIPELKRDVAYVNNQDKSGFQCYWTDEKGRRDLGQQFTVSSVFSARSLALQINSGGSSLEGCPFRIIFAHRKTGSTQPGKVIAIQDGFVPGKGQRPRSGTWLILEFPAVQFESGAYCFLLQYKEAGPAGQAITLNTAGAANAYSGGEGLQSYSADPSKIVAGRAINFILSSDSWAEVENSNIPRILEVDRRGGTPYASLEAAANVIRAGDTLRIAPGSGPYREQLYIRASGRPDAPITVEGNGELVTGFDPLAGFREENGVMVCDLPVEFPCVVTYRGERLRQSAATRQFTKYARLSGDSKRIELLPGTDTNNWEVSVRYFAVRIQDASNHIYRNLKASGAQNDGFNLHGTGSNIIFKNIEGFQNLDEGFSSHDNIASEIRGGLFYDNDNGIVNINSSVTLMENVSVYNNLGWGFRQYHQCTGILKQFNSYSNGICQIEISGESIAQITNCTASVPPWTERQWTSYMESRNHSVMPAVKIDPEAEVAGYVTTE
ncbi:MAG: right-handed parallel beta-helix repeat-containing protein [Kiritimatiellales bacterium]